MFHVFPFNLLRHRQTNLGPSIRVVGPSEVLNVAMGLGMAGWARWERTSRRDKTLESQKDAGKARPRPSLFMAFRGRIFWREVDNDSGKSLHGCPPPPFFRDKSPTWREDSTLQVVTPEYLKPLYVKFFPLWRCETQVFTVLQL